MKRLLLILLCVVGQSSLSQNYSDNWEAFFSYTSITDLVRSGDIIYAASDNAIAVYNTQLGSVETISSVNGLSGEPISQIHYSQNYDVLIVTFTNGLIQLIPESGDVINVVAIRDKQIIASDRKQVNEFLEVGNLLYMATDFGIALYNLDILEFDNTYFIGDNGAQLQVNSIEIDNGFIYAATNGGGMRRAAISNPFLLDFMNWTQINLDVWEEVTAFNNNVYAVTAGRFVAERNTSNVFSGLGFQLPFRARDVFVTSDRITYATSDDVLIYDTSFNEIFRLNNIDGETYQYTSAILVNNDLYLGTESAGLIRVNIIDSSDFEFIFIDGPQLNTIFSIESVPGELWVTYGEHNGFYVPSNDRRGISHLTEDGWINYTHDQVNGLLSIPTVTINPDNTNELLIHSMNNGVLDFVDGVAGATYGINNSTLESILPPSAFFVRSTDGAYDSQGNLWLVQPQVELAVHKRNTSGQWTGYDVSQFIQDISDTNSTKMQITDNDQIIYGTTSRGVVAYDPQMDSYAQLTEGTQSGNLINNNVTSLKIDQRGQLWIGSNRGLRLLSSVRSLFDDTITDARAIIIEDTNGIPRELFADQIISDIEVDGNNNKWIATGGSGVFLISPSGRETLLQFTKDNSPLPDNNVRDIAIDSSTGLIYMATPNGLVAYRGDRASKPQDNLDNVYAFPNPVRPGFEGNVTIDGLTNRARVKVTDIEGNLVYESVSQGGSIQWDTRSFSGRKVASGVYMVFISTNDNIETTVSKIMIVR